MSMPIYIWVFIYGGPFVSKFKCYIFIQITFKMHSSVFIQDVQFSFKILCIQDALQYSL